ncbi:hypothetical protein DSZ55_28600, partial [Escherichia coli]|nr:hypothetical protein [Escherichia coli]
MSTQQNITQAVDHSDLSRRRFLKLSSFLGMGAYLSTHSMNAIAAAVIDTHVGEVTKWHNCWAHCHSSCLLKI